MVRNQGRAAASKEASARGAAKNRGGKLSCNRNSMVANGKRKRRELALLQDFLRSPEDILKKIFRKDGPPLGVEFDSLPSRAFRHCKGKFKMLIPFLSLSLRTHRSILKI